MNIVYYYDPNLKSSPVKRYLNQFDLGVAKDLALLAAIDSKIIFLSCQKSHPHPPISKPLHDYNFFEIRHRKNKNILIRVIYFCCDERMILLNAFEKPDNYDSQKIKKNIEKFFDTTARYRQEYLKNKNLYEDYK
jgi:hypothetical protein